MTDYILHHFDASPFAEKIRLVFGVKALSWSSVEIPMIMPKPDLTALTGGYRKTPVLQIGADIFCDTLLIAQEIERRAPTPSLFPDGARGLSLALGRWSDKAFFEPGAALSMGENPQVPDAVINDRKAFFNFMDFDQLAQSLPAARLQLKAHLSLVNNALNTQTPYLDGATPGYQDILAWFPVWMIEANVPSAKTLLAPFERVRNWSTQMHGVGHGHRSNIDASAAIQTANETTPSDDGSVYDNPLGLTRGDQVAVYANDYGQERMTGSLLHLDFERITIRREDPRCGALNLHVPVIGFEITAT